MYVNGEDRWRVCLWDISETEFDNLFEKRCFDKHVDESVKFIYNNFLAEKLMLKLNSQKELRQITLPLIDIL